jgi:hypothetical protein
LLQPTDGFNANNEENNKIDGIQDRMKTYYANTQKFPLWRVQNRSSVMQRKKESTAAN